jgi:hypothetical protein
MLSMEVSDGSVTPAVLVGVLAILILLSISSRRYRLPPGPLGNVAAEFAKSPMPLLFERWRKQYGTQQTSSLSNLSELVLMSRYS